MQDEGATGVTRERTHPDPRGVLWKERSFGRSTFLFRIMGWNPHFLILEEGEILFLGLSTLMGMWVSLVRTKKICGIQVGRRHYPPPSYPNSEVC